MRVCLIAEGCYPYNIGGVSGWIHSMIQSFPNLEFVLVAVVSSREQSGKFVYELPENLTEVHEVYLQDVDWDHSKKRGRRTRLSRREYGALRSVILNREPHWDPLFELFQDRDISVDEILMGADFLRVVTECYEDGFSQTPFTDYLWTMRSIYLPLFLTMQTEIPEADLYHCTVTGYAGVLGAMAKYLHGGGLMVSEHGIYTREREEELIKAKWVTGIYKNIWINQFRKMSSLAYDRADLVTSLYGHARKLQLELGCPEDKTVITPNGIEVERFAQLPGKPPEDKGFVDICATLRITPIKDVKTMIQAYALAKMRAPSIRLWILGPRHEDPKYADECVALVESLELSDVFFEGRVDVREYLGRMDMSILTSISEGQPLSILESFAAGKPVIATDVGNCRGLIQGEEGDELGEAGMVVHVMNIEEIATAMADLAADPERRRQLGENGYRRVCQKHRIQDMRQTYSKIYRAFAAKQGAQWSEEPFRIYRQQEGGRISYGGNRTEADQYIQA